MAKTMISATLEGEKLRPAELHQIDIFKDVDMRQLERFPGTVVKRQLAPGEVICREGEGGTTAFYILAGQVKVFIGGRAEARTKTRSGGGLMGFLDRLFGSPQVTAPTHAADKLVPIDASVDLTYGALATTLGAGEVFGEMSCLNLAPRSATVVTETSCVVLEMLRNVYELLQKAPTFRQRQDENYRARSLAAHLRNAPLLEGIAAADIEKLRTAAQLLSVDSGHEIFKEDDPADDPTTGGFYLVRLGQVRVSRKSPGGEQTLAYLMRGDCFGETGLLHHSKRNATCQAVDHPIFEEGRKRRSARVELVRIPPENFTELITRYPKLRGKLEMIAAQRERAQAQRSKKVMLTPPSKQMEDLGLMQGQNLMLIDLEKCTRCDQCVDACVAAHDDGMTRLIRSGPRYDKFLVPSSCRMCMDPVCMIGCPVGSIRRGEDLQIFIEDWCIGCGVCAKQCPYDSIQMHNLEDFGKQVSGEAKRYAEGGNVVAVTERAVVCDQCSSLPTGPACVYACPHDAALRVDAADFFEAKRTVPLELFTPGAAAVEE